MNRGDAHLIFNGQSRRLKFYVYGDGNPRHIWTAHDVGVNDSTVLAGEDVYGHECKIPPGVGYTLGAPQACGPNSPDGQAYGFWFTPINDNAQGVLEAHGRAGLGIHGGGSDLADSFAPYQGWEWTFGCIRLQNADNGMATPTPGCLVYSLQYIQKQGGTVYLDVCWP